MKRATLIMVGPLLIGLWVGVVFADNSRFIFSDMTVKDKHTGLIWMRNANLGKHDRDGAAELVRELNREKYAGFDDWTIPSIEELESLVKYASDLGYNSYPKGPNKLFNEMGFYEVQAGLYWSSTIWIFMPFSGVAWGMKMDNGNTDQNNKANLLYVWPVRDGR
jgi:hypothetical protein